MPVLELRPQETLMLLLRLLGPLPSEQACTTLLENKRPC